MSDLQSKIQEAISEVIEMAYRKPTTLTLGEKAYSLLCKELSDTHGRKIDNISEYLGLKIVIKYGIEPLYVIVD